MKPRNTEKEMHMRDINSGEVWTLDDKNRVIHKRAMTKKEMRAADVSFWKSLKLPKDVEKEMIKNI